MASTGQTEAEEFNGDTASRYGKPDGQVCEIVITRVNEKIAAILRRQQDLDCRVCVARGESAT
ncbi:hypothetical protein [Crateriforma conspicua]|uniref:hypothetical protein n=1 Tax=Crateriforma conspicua TaxID=2527996 RepID=UPI0011B6F872|nr:hypothetical protein [Crateriforma conspicua]